MYTQRNFNTRRKYIIFFVFVIGLIINTTIRAEDNKGQPRFSDTIIRLDVPFDQAISLIRLSPQGNYAAGYINRTHVQIQEGKGVGFDVFEKHVFFWDLTSKIQYKESVIQGIEVPILDYSSQKMFVFSPNEKFLAFQLASGIQIWRVPELQLMVEIPFSTPNSIEQNPYDSLVTFIGEGKSLGWSADSKVLVAANNTEIISWNAITQTVNRYSLPYNSAKDVGFFVEVIPFSFGWIVQPKPITLSPDYDYFNVCGLELEHCDEYPFPSIGDVTVSPDGNLILTRRLNQASQQGLFGVWERKYDNYYHLDNLLLSIPRNTKLQGFSRDGRYLLIPGGTLSKTTIWDYPKGVEVSDSGPVNVRQIAWLGNQDFLIGINIQNYESGDLSLNIYNINSFDPISSISLLNLAKNEVNYLSTYYDIQYINVESITNDGKYVLLNAGKTALVIPVLYS